MTRLSGRTIKALRLVPNATDDQYQAHGIDLRIGGVFRPVLKPFGEHIGDSDYVSVETSSSEFDPATRTYTLMGPYVVKVAEVIDLRPRDGYPPITSIVLARSSLTRRGIFLGSSLWESGYLGSGYVALFCSVPLRIRKGVRFAQMAFDFSEDTEDVYRGQYQHEGMELRSGDCVRVTDKGFVVEKNEPGISMSSLVIGPGMYPGDEGAIAVNTGSVSELGYQKLRC